jgi:hypothetical protein
MTKTLLRTVLFALIFPCFSFAQEYSYSHYNITEGLAGSTVYSITQDKDGFIWTGTDAGVSRFDGTHFKNFTTKEGLPDIEVLQIFADSKGRIWMAPFHKSVCFYYRGKIHNEQNDPLLSRIHLKENIISFAEDAHGNILIHQRNALHLVKADGSVRQYDSLDHEAIRKCNAVSTSSSGHFLAQVGEKIIEFSAEQCIRSMPFQFDGGTNPNSLAMNSTRIAWMDGFAYNIRLFSRNNIIHWLLDRTHVKHISFSLTPDDSLVYMNQSSGTLEYNVNTGQTTRYLPGIPVSRVFRDATGNLWWLLSAGNRG